MSAKRRRVQGSGVRGQKEEIPPSPPFSKGGEKLRFIRIVDLDLVPKRLVEQVKGMDYTPEELYGLWPLYAQSPYNLLFALADGEHLIQGFVWCSVLPLQKALFVNTVSLDRGWQGRGLLQDLIRPFLEKLREQLGLKKGMWLSTRPRALERLGFQRDRQVLMEG